MDAAPVRIGILGAARIAPLALIGPARKVPEASIAAIAARDESRARRFARRYSVPRVHATYEDLLADDQIDAVYVPLPNSLHAAWSIRAMRAGKHVLCEKPLASNAGEAEAMVAVSRETGRLLVEAVHYRFHPLAARMREIVASGRLGQIQSMDAYFGIPLISRGNIRYRFDLAGGALMDVGFYTVNLLRFLAGSEPAEVVQARARLASPQVDRDMSADLRLPGGVHGHIECSLFSFRLWKLGAVVTGDRGEMRVFNPYMPQFGYRLRVRDARGWKSERVPRVSTYRCQLEAFVRAIRHGEPLPVDLNDAVANARVIDQIYEKAGLKPRGQ